MLYIIMTLHNCIFDINDINIKTNEFDVKFKALTNLSPGNKIGIDKNNNLYAEYIQQPYIMAIVRKITGQKRQEINTYLNVNLQGYELLLLYLINAYENDTIQDESSIKFNSIFLTHKILCIGIVNGLTNLKLAYPDYKDILDTCDTYIVKLNLFRTKSNNMELPFINNNRATDLT